MLGKKSKLLLVLCSQRDSFGQPLSCAEASCPSGSSIPNDTAVFGPLVLNICSPKWTVEYLTRSKLVDLFVGKLVHQLGNLVHQLPMPFL